ncbi:MAG: hypothetical protein HDR88_04200, partial [Bacteroides sp.]|nr:hypothetical protein [Bacteroides sp.]
MNPLPDRARLLTLSCIFYPGAETLAFEKDLITGKILAALHPSITTEISGFEKIDEDYNGYFDVACSNIPFGDFAVADPKFATSKEIAYRQSIKAINYFFLKALDQVREEGLVAFIASQGVMNSASPFVRMELVKRSDLVAALCLSNNTFSDNAGTDAGSDLIILQKHTGKKALSADEEFFIQSVVDRQTNVSGNKFFQAFPQNVICTDAKLGTDQYGKPALIYTHKDGVTGIAHDLREVLDESLRLRLNMELYNSNGIKPPTPDPVKPTPKPTPQKSKVAQTPLMKQYEEMKKKHPDAILLFRVGDFYEMFGKDAVEASEVLGITLTRRMNGKADPIELTGFPHHALDTYLPKFVRAGKRVAICEQLEDPKQTMKVVEKVEPASTVKAEPMEQSKPEPIPEPQPEVKHETPVATPSVEPTKEQEIGTSGTPDYSDNPDPRLFAYNLFGELEPREAPGRQRQPISKPTPKKASLETTPRPKREVKVIKHTGYRKLTDQELELYGSLNWEDNPPINGFYEAMMNIAYAQLTEREAERQAAKTELIEEDGVMIEKQVGDFVPDGRSSVKSVPKEQEQQVDMSPRPFSEDIQFFHHNGSIVIQDGQVGFLSEVRKSGATFTPLALKPEQTKRAMLYITLSETYQQLYHYEAETHEPSEHLREHLNQYYDEFVEKYGNLNEKQNVKFILMDANGRDALALERGENGQFVKADIFDHPVSFAIDEVTSVDTPLEALTASLNKYGEVNLEYMGSLVDMEEDTLIENLEGHIFYNPLVNNYEIKDRFIAGNVVAKAESVKAWIDREEERISNFPGYDGIEPYIALSKDSLKALEEARPRRIEFDELDFNFGERWIPTDIYSAYMSHLYETDIKIAYSSSMDEYSATNSRGNMKIWEEFCVRGYYRTYDGMSLLKHALHNTVPDIKKSIGKDKNDRDIKVPDTEAIQLANTKIDEIRNGFSDWLGEQSPEFKERLVNLYNDKFN